MNDSIRFRAEKEGARLLPRICLHPQPHNSDVAHLQLLVGEKFAMLHPERHAAELRALLGAA